MRVIRTCGMAGVLLGGLFALSSPAYAYTSPVGPSPDLVNITIPSSVVNFKSVCSYPSDSSAGCASAALADINYGRSLESLSPITLPSDFSSEPVDQEILFLINSERTSRGLAPLQIDPYLDQQTVASLAVGQVPADPNIDTSGNVTGDLTGLGQPDLLVAFFTWMYETGTSSTSWTRSIILGDWGTGTGFIGAASRTLDASTGHPVISLGVLIEDEIHSPLSDQLSQGISSGGAPSAPTPPQAQPTPPTPPAPPVPHSSPASPTPPTTTPLVAPLPRLPLQMWHFDAGLHLWI